MVGLVPTVFYEVDENGDIIQNGIFASLPPIKGEVERDGVVFSRSGWGGIVITNNTKSSIIIAEETDQSESPLPGNPQPSFKLPTTYQECLSFVQEGQDFSNAQAVQFINAARSLVEDGKIPSAELRHLKEALERNLNIDERQMTDTEIHDAWLKFIQSGRSVVDNLALASNQSQLLKAWESLLMLDLASEDLNEFLDSNWYGNDAMNAQQVDQPEDAK